MKRYIKLPISGESFTATTARRMIRKYAGAVKKRYPKLAARLIKKVDGEWMRTKTAQKAGKALMRFSQREQR